MTPTTWIGTTALCAVLGLLVTVFGKAMHSGEFFGRMTEAVERMDTTLQSILGEIKGHSAILNEHDRRIYDLEQAREHPDVVRFPRRNRGQDA